MQPLMPTPVHLDKVLEGLAANEKLPRGLLPRLLRHRGACRAAAKRSDLTESLADAIIELGMGVTLALHPNLPPSVKERLAESPDPWVRIALATRERDLSSPWFERFAADPSAEVRKSVAENDHAPPDVRARLASDPEPEVRARLAQWWTDAPQDIRRGWLTDGDPTVRAAACATYFPVRLHPVPPPDLHPALLDDPVTRAGVVRYLTLDPATARRLATDPNPEVRKAVAAHPELPPHLRDLLARDDDPSVRVDVFARSDTSEEVRAAIHSDLLAGSERFGTAPAAADEQDLASCLGLIELSQLHIPWVMSDPLPHLDAPYACFRRSAALSSGLTPEAVTRLLADEDNIVRATMAARTPDLDLETAERIERLHQESAKSPERPADHVAFPPRTLRRFATDPDPRMRTLAPRDPTLPAELAEGLASDEDHRVRAGAAAHPNLPVTALLVLLADENAQVAETAARSPALPPKAMDQLLALAGL